MSSFFRAPLLLIGLILSVAVQPATAQTNQAPLGFQSSPRLQKIVDNGVEITLKQFAPQNLKSNELAITLVDLNDAARPAWASYRGNERTYPASVIKMFCLVAAHRWM